MPQAVTAKTHHCHIAPSYMVMGFFPLTTDFALHRKALSFCGSLPELPVSLQWQPLDGAILSAITAAVIHMLFGPSPTAAHAHGLGLTCATAATGQSNTGHATFSVPWGNGSYCKCSRQRSKGQSMLKCAAMDHMLHTSRTSSSRWKTGTQDYVHCQSCPSFSGSHATPGAEQQQHSMTASPREHFAAQPLSRGQPWIPNSKSTMKARAFFLVGFSPSRSSELQRKEPLRSWHQADLGCTGGSSSAHTRNK